MNISDLASQLLKIGKLPVQQVVDPMTALKQSMGFQAGTEGEGKLYTGGYEPGSAADVFYKNNPDVPKPSEYQAGTEGEGKPYVGGYNQYGETANAPEWAKTPADIANGRPLDTPIKQPVTVQDLQNARLYHGTDRPWATPFAEGNPQTGTNGNMVKRPVVKFNDSRFSEPTRDYERGVFMTPDPDTAARYSGYNPNAHFSDPYIRGSNVIPLEADLTNSSLLDLNQFGGRSYKSELVDEAIKRAEQQGSDFLIIRGMHDVGGNSDQVVALRPAGKVRNAITKGVMYGAAGLLAADPRRQDNLLAGQ